MKSIFIIAIVAVAMIGVMVPSVFADSDYSKIKVKYASTHILEFEKYNVIRTAFTIENDDIQKFQTYYTYLTADDTILYEISTSYDIDEIGDKTCPNTNYDIEINPGLEEEYVFCFQVPKSFSNNFTLKFMSTSPERCAMASTNQFITCQESTYPLGAISNPTKISYDSLLKTFVKNFDNMDANVSNVELMEFRDLNVLIMTVSIFNKGSSELIGWNIDATAKSISGLEFDTTYYTDINCDGNLENINPGITKTFKLCFDVPKNETAFDLALRSGFGFGGSGSLSDCDGMWADCNELFINIIVPEPIVESTPVVPTPVVPTPVAPTAVAPTGIASFVDQTKDPQHYIDRYNNESTYKEWFDENYSQYSSIYEAVGLEEPVIEITPEPTAEYTSVPTVSEPNCGTGTESVNGICQVIQTEEKSSKGGGCLIATATYGSEMAPQVQQLRELRDNQLLQTESGTAFMGTFNDIYYSFSPIIADYERENPYFKEAVKLAITPMISTLSLMENAESESDVLSIGLSVIALNLGMYLGVPAIVIIGIRRKF